MLTGEHAFHEARMVAGETRGAGFYPLLIAAASVADTDNLERLRVAFPDVIAELEARRAAPGGELDEATEERIDAMHRTASPTTTPAQPSGEYRAQQYTNPTALAYMAQGRCPECGEEVDRHGGPGVPGGCILSDYGVAVRLDQYQRDAEAAAGG